MVKIAIIGAGFMGKTHADAYRKMEKAEVVALCDKNAELGKDFSDTYECAYYDDIELLLQECKVDVVDICVPTFLHEEYALTAAKHKKHIFCEKPVTLSVAVLDRIMGAVKEAGVRMFVGQAVRFWPEYTVAKKMYEEGSLGELKTVYAARLAQHPVWSEWYRRPENSGGGLFDLHLHDIDFLCYLLGKAEYVYAAGKKNSYGCWNHVTSMVTFQNGVSAAVEGIMEMAQGYPFTMQLRLVGESKVFEYQMKAGSNLEDVASAVRETKLYENGEIQVLPRDETDAYESELFHFVECIEENKDSSVITMEQVKNVLCTIEAIRESLETGNKIKITYQEGSV